MENEIYDIIYLKKTYLSPVRGGLPKERKNAYSLSRIDWARFDEGVGVLSLLRKTP